MKYDKNQPDISKTGRRTWPWNKFLFLIKGLSIKENFTVGDESSSIVPHEIWKWKVLISPFAVITIAIYYLRLCRNLGWNVPKKSDYCDGSEFCDISYFPLIYMHLGYPLTCFVAFHIKWNGINVHLKLIMLILQMQIACYLQCS